MHYDVSMVLSAFKNTLLVSKNFSIFQCMHMKLVVLSWDKIKGKQAVSLLKKKRCFYKKHSYLTSKLQALKGETLLLEIFERIHEYVWR